jgi:septal ring factor EnvC (AmiA/AmiB activator)
MSGRTASRHGVFITMLVAVALATAALPLSSSAHQSLSQLNSNLGATQSQVNSLSSSVHTLDGLISTLGGQISLVQSREAAVRVALADDEAQLAKVQGALGHERGLLSLLERRLARARLILSRQLVSNYEQGSPGLMTAVLEARGFADLLDKLDYLHAAEHQQQTLITLTREAKVAATVVTHRLTGLTATDRQITETTGLRERALVGMNELLSGKQAALQHARAAQAVALSAARSRGAALRSAIAKVQAEQAAAEAAQQSSYSSGSASGPALGPSGGWAIPYAIVLCESGGQDLPPNSAGASGYYQIIPSTWRLFDGTGPAAYLAPKSEQDAVASRIWNGGAGASNWVCAGIVGIH